MKYLPKIITGLLATAMVAGLNGCIEKDPELPITQVLMVPLSPNAPPTDFVLNGNRMATTVNYSSTVGTATYTLPYYTIVAGNTEISYTLTGTNNKFAATTMQLEADRAYSTFLIDSINKIKLAFVNDDVSDPSVGKVKLRFLHFSPNTPALNVAVVATGANLFTNRSFNDQATNSTYERFIEVDPGTYTFQFKLVSSGAVAYTTSALTLLPDRIYTLAARGFTGGAGNLALGGWFYANKAQ